MSSRARFSIVCLFFLTALLLPGQALKASFVTKQSAQKAPELLTAVPVSLPLRVIQAARSYLGVPYVHAGDTRAGMDCSGFVARVFADTMGANLPRGVDGLFKATAAASSPLHIGDLLFFDTTDNGPPSSPTHVGIYLGGGKVAHAASEGPNTGVIVSALNDPYYRDRFIGARRVLPWRDPVLDVTLTDETEQVVQVEPFASQEDVAIRVFNAMSGGGPVSLTLFKDGRQVLSRWIAAGAGKPAAVSFTAGVGSWSVRITRIFKGRTLSDMTFTVVE